MRKQVLILITAIFLLSFAGCGEQDQPSSNQPEDTTMQMVGETEGTQEERAQAFVDSIEQEKSTMKTYKEIISQSTNPSDCNVLIDSYYRTACFNQVIVNQVKKTYDTSLCDQIEDQQIQRDCMMIQPESEN
ncbi:hypothetical protein GF369_01575 [Candidatus Peregrinibacteria bacterium]|nr:hypothetical protein [Candidatus Peregrinibacteria bacterium]